MDNAAATDEQVADFHLHIAQDAVSNAANYAKQVCALLHDVHGMRRHDLIADFFRWHRCAKINLALAEFALLPERPAKRTLRPLGLRAARKGRA